MQSYNSLHHFFFFFFFFLATLMKGFFSIVIPVISPANCSSSVNYFAPWYEMLLAILLAPILILFFAKTYFTPITYSSAYRATRS